MDNIQDALTNTTVTSRLHSVAVNLQTVLNNISAINQLITGADVLTEVSDVREMSINEYLCVIEADLMRVRNETGDIRSALGEL